MRAGDADAVLGENIRRTRALLGASQAHVTAAAVQGGLDWTKTTLGKIERGMRRVTAVELVTLSLILGTLTDELLDGVAEAMNPAAAVCPRCGHMAEVP